MEMRSLDGLLLLILGAGVFVLVYGMWIRARITERLAGLYQKALEHGADPSTIRLQLEERELGDPQGNLKAGIILLATALAILGGIFAADRLPPGPYRGVIFVFVPAAIGLACLFIHFAVPRNNKGK
jgi:hypothetical protein